MIRSFEMTGGQPPDRSLRASLLSGYCRRIALRSASESIPLLADQPSGALAGETGSAALAAMPV